MTGPVSPGTSADKHHWPTVIGGSRACLPQHREPLQTQAQVENVLEYSPQLGSTSFKYHLADAIETRGLAWADSTDLFPQLFLCEGWCAVKSCACAVLEELVMWGGEVCC